MNWKGWVLFVLVHWVLPGAATLALLAGFRRRWPAGLPASAWDRWSVPLFLLSRGVYLVVLYSLLGYRGSGDYAFWTDRATRLLAGEVPGRDVFNAYGPLFPYLQAGSLALTGGRWLPAVLLPFLLGDALAVFLGRKLVREVLGGGAAAWTGAWLLLSPLLWHQLVARGGKEALFAGALVAAAWCILRGRHARAAVVLALGLCATKVTFLPYAFALWLASRREDPRPWRSAAAAAAVLAAVCVPYALRGGDLLEFTRYRAEGLWCLNLSTPLHLLVAGDAGRRAALALYLLLAFAAPILGLRLCPGGSTGWRCCVAVAWAHAASLLSQPWLTANHLVQGLPFVLAVLAAAGPSRLAGALLGVLPVLGFLVCVTSSTGDRLYVLGAAPLSLVFHAGLVVLLARRSEGPAPEFGAAPSPLP